MDTEHILLGVMRVHENLAAQILMNLGLSEDLARIEIEKVLRSLIIWNKTRLSLRRLTRRSFAPSAATGKSSESFGAATVSPRQTSRRSKRAKQFSVLFQSLRRDCRGSVWNPRRSSDVNRLAMQDYELQLEKEKAVASYDFDKATQCLSV